MQNQICPRHIKTLRFLAALITAILTFFFGIGGGPYSARPNPIYCGVSDEDEARMTTDTLTFASWGKIGDIDLRSPFSSLDIQKLLAISIGAMPPDLVRDGLPWFGAVRDDFLGRPRGHKGLDFYPDQKEEAKVRAMADGVITVIGTTKTAGFYVKIDHGDGVETLYIHLKSPYEGKKEVRQGDILGLVGTSGNAVSPQLHLGIKVKGEYIDPMEPLKDSAGEDTLKLISYYESLYPSKTRARGHLVRAYFTADEKTRSAELENALEIFETIAGDKVVSTWLKDFDEDLLLRKMVTEDEGY